VEVRRTYQDFVIKDGKFVGDFDGMYQNFDEPWHQSPDDYVNGTHRSIAIDYCDRIRAEHPEVQLSRVVEYGCGFGYLTDALRQRGFSAVGVDVSDEAVSRARIKNPSSIYLKRSFDDPDLLRELDPDIIVMAEITWYVLDHLADFLNRLREHAAGRERPTYLIHLLTTYAPGVQRYGTDFFTDLDGILAYFDLDYLESGSVAATRSGNPLSHGTYFVGRVTG